MDGDKPSPFSWKTRLCLLKNLKRFYNSIQIGSDSQERGFADKDMLSSTSQPLGTGMIKNLPESID